MELSNLIKIKESIENGTNVTINDIGLAPYFVKKNQEMRLDNISFELYGNTKYVTELAYLNGITNVFSIKEGDILMVTDEDSIGSVFNFTDTIIAAIKDAIREANTKKKGKIDQNRLLDKSNRKNAEQDKRIPPVIINNDKIVVEDGKMVLKTNF